MMTPPRGSSKSVLLILVLLWPASSGAVLEFGGGVSAGGGGGGATWPNEPAGSTLITDFNFSATGGSGWVDNYNTATIVSDPSAPLSPNSVIDFYYPIGFVAGSAPDTIYYPLTTPTKLYYGYWWKVSNPWDGQISNINKITFQLGNSNALIQIMYGSGSGPFKLMNSLEFPTVNNGHLTAGGSFGDSPGTWQLFGNVSAGTVSLGVWHQVEVIMIKSSGETSQNGTLKWWLDGTLIGNYTNVNYPSEFLGEFQFSPTWGGVGSTKSTNDHYWFDHVHVSTPP